jgi:hypothetical protein
LVADIEGGSRVRVYDITVLRRIFGTKRDKVTRDWRKLQILGYNDLYCSPNIVQVIKSIRMRWAGHVARMGERRGVFRTFVGEPLGKEQLGRPRRRWEDNIKMDKHGVGCGVVDRNELIQDRDSWRAFANAVMNIRVP